MTTPEDEEKVKSTAQNDSLPPRKRLKPTPSSSIPHTRIHQTNFSPNKGNALQAVVASALCLPTLDEVPNFIETPSLYGSLRQFLSTRGLGFIKIECTSDGSLLTHNVPTSFEKGCICVVAGPSPRGAHRHCVLGSVRTEGDDEKVFIDLVWDPHPSNDMIEKPYAWVGFFVALSIDTKRTL